MEFIDHHQRLPAEMKRLFGSRTGMISDIIRIPTPRDGPGIYSIVGQQQCDLSYILGNQEDVEIEAGGKGLSEMKANTRMVGEFLERYCLRSGTKDESVRTRYADLASETDCVIDVDYLRVHSHHQYAEVDEIEEITPETERCFRTGRNLITGESYWVPIELVQYDLPEEYVPCQIPTSNGCACHHRPKKAIANCVFELIERDAFISTWYRQVPPRRLSLEHFSEVQELVRSLENDMLEIKFWEYRTGLDVPTVGCAVIRCDDRMPKIAIAGSAAIDYEHAVLDALLEAVQSHMSMKYRLASTEEAIPDDASLDFMESALYHAQPHHFDKMRFLFSGEPQSPAGHGAPGSDELQYVLDKLGEVQATPIAFDLTTPDVAELGYVVTRVVVPELLPLSPPTLPYERHPRLAGTMETEMPHPYP